MPTARKDRRYLGMGVYAYHDGYLIWLESEHPDHHHRIALDPRVFNELIAYGKLIRSKHSDKELSNVD